MEEPEIGSGSGDVPVVATVDLDQFFNRMERQLERQMHTLTDRTESREETADNPVIRVLREMKSFADMNFRGSGEPSIAEKWLSAVEFRFRSLGVTDSILMAKVAPNLFTGDAIEWWRGRQAIHTDEEMTWT